MPFAGFGYGRESLTCKDEGGLNQGKWTHQESPIRYFGFGKDTVRVQKDSIVGKSRKSDKVSVFRF